MKDLGLVLDLPVLGMGPGLAKIESPYLRQNLQSIQFVGLVTERPWADSLSFSRFSFRPCGEDNDTNMFCVATAPGLEVIMNIFNLVKKTDSQPDNLLLIAL